MSSGSPSLPRGTVDKNAFVNSSLMFLFTASVAMQPGHTAFARTPLRAY